MKLQMTFPTADGGTQSIEHPWNDAERYEDNWRLAAIKAMKAGMTLQHLREGCVKIKAIKERDGERCPCCNEPLK